MKVDMRQSRRLPEELALATHLGRGVPFFFTLVLQLRFPRKGRMQRAKTKGVWLNPHQEAGELGANCVHVGQVMGTRNSQAGNMG